MCGRNFSGSAARIYWRSSVAATRRFSDLARHPDNERIEGVLIFRVEAALLYLNADNVRQTVLNRVRTEGPCVSW
jgi:MFS superfamily sulfate permease-like transporter